MVLKGNLLYNGDFETGTTEGWVCGPYEQLCQCDFSASTGAKLRGNYGGYLKAQVDLAAAYIAYNKICSFEEYEGYLFILPVKMISGISTAGVLWGLDDKGNVIKTLYLGENTEAGIWRDTIVLLRGYRNITHFQVGFYFVGEYAGDECYFDEVKLLPLKSIKGHEIKDYRIFNNVSSNKTWYSVIACIGKCIFRSHIAVRNVAGTSPTLDTTIEIGLLEGVKRSYTLTHSQFTTEGEEEKKIDLPDVSVIKITYTVGGSSPSFDIYHSLTLEPY